MYDIELKDQYTINQPKKFTLVNFKSLYRDDEIQKFKEDFPKLKHFSEIVTKQKPFGRNLKGYNTTN